MAKFKRAVKAVGKCILLGVVALAVLYGGLSLLLGWRVKRELKAIEARGELVSLSEIAAEPIPDAENGALVYAQAFDAINEPSMSKDLDIMSYFVLLRYRTVDPALWEGARGALERNEHILRLIEQAAARPKCRFPVEWEAGAGAQFPHVGNLRRLTHLTRTKAVLSARDGVMGDAADSVILTLRIGESLKHEPSYIALLSRRRIGRMASATLQDALQYGDLNEAQARAVYDVLAEIEFSNAFAEQLQAERAWGLWWFDLTRRRPRTIAETITACEADTCRSLRWKVLGNYRLLPALYAEELVYLKLLEEQVGAAHLTYREVETIRPELDRPPDLPFYALLTERILPDMRKMRAKRDDAIARTRGDQIFLALLAYKQRFGRYPATLGQLRAELGWDLQEDPFSGREFAYKRQGDGFLLYSFGANLKDDGGHTFPGEPVQWYESPMSPKRTMPEPMPGMMPGAPGSAPPVGPPPPAPPGPVPPGASAAPAVHFAPQPAAATLAILAPPYEPSEMRYFTFDSLKSYDIVWRRAR